MCDVIVLCCVVLCAGSNLSGTPRSSAGVHQGPAWEPCRPEVLHLPASLPPPRAGRHHREKRALVVIC